MSAFQNDQIKLEHFDELEACYDDNVTNVKERLSKLEVIGDPYIMLDDEEYEDEIEAF